MSRRKQGTSIRAMADVFAPPVGLLCKLGSIAVHVEEAAGDGGHAFDWIAIRSLLADREVQDWIGGMRDAGLMPVKRPAAAPTAPADHSEQQQPNPSIDPQ